MRILLPACFGPRARRGLARCAAALTCVLATAANAQWAIVGDASGSTIGPDGALYVTEPVEGSVLRIDRKTGAYTTFATGLPKRVINFGPDAGGIGGAMDVEFIGKTAYVLVSAVGASVGGNPEHQVGIYRVDDKDSFTVVADIGEFAIDEPPDTFGEGDVTTGIQYAMERYGRGFLVTDGNHNRVYRVTLRGDKGKVTELIAFDNIVPTGLALLGNLIFMTEAGPAPHLPEDGKVVVFGPWRNFVWEVASGAPLLVDVEFARGQVFALSQGSGIPGAPPGAPAAPSTGTLVRANWDGSFTVIAEGLNLPTSVEIVGDTAYVVGLLGEIWKIDNVTRRRGYRWWWSR